MVVLEVQKRPKCSLQVDLPLFVLFNRQNQGQNLKSNLKKTNIQNQAASFDEIHQRMWLF
jgi:hypothetical protein